MLVVGSILRRNAFVLPDALEMRTSAASKHFVASLTIGVLCRASRAELKMPCDGIAGETGGLDDIDQRLAAPRAHTCRLAFDQLGDGIACAHIGRRKSLKHSCHVLATG